MAVKTYDPAKIFINFIGIPLTGYADGTFVEVEESEDRFMTKVGADGEVARARNRNRSATVKVTLIASSASNDALNAASQVDLNSGQGYGSFFIKDGNGTTLIVAPNAWVQKPASVSFGKEVGTCEWTFFLDQVTYSVGGTIAA